MTRVGFQLHAILSPHFFLINHSARVGVRSIAINPSVCLCVCLSGSISLEPLEWSARNFVCGSNAAVARSSSGGVELRYVLPVLWMTSRLALMGVTPTRVGSPHRRRSITCATGAESDVYECLLSIELLTSNFYLIIIGTGNGSD